jgi:hypothetical protein
MSYGRDNGSAKASKSGPEDTAGPMFREKVPAVHSAHITINKIISSKHRKQSI